nr:Hpt domain-containing protein [uncultured Pseudodesulfovibrio sp.]
MLDSHTPIVRTYPALELDEICEFMELTRDEIMMLVPKAIEEVEYRLDLIRRSVETNALNDIVLHSHTLKSVAASIGARATREVVAALESVAKKGDTDMCVRLIAQLEEEVSRLAAEVAAL